MKEKIYNLQVNIEMILKMIKYYNINQKEATKPKKLGEKIVLLGNGPSLKNFMEYRKEFESYDKLVVNFFPIKSDKFDEIRPRYLCLLDPMFFTDARYKHPKYKEIIELYEKLEKVEWDLYIVTRAGYSLPIENPNIKYIKIAASESFGVESTSGIRYFKKNRMVVPCQNVLLAALNFAIMFEYKQIGLVGVEQNWMQTLVVDQQNDLYTQENYFYGRQNIKLNATYESELWDVLRTMKAYRILSIVAETLKVEILNYAPMSYLQYFRKVCLEKEIESKEE